MQRTVGETVVKSLAAKFILRLLLLALLGAGAWLWFALSPVNHAPGVLIQCAPVQTESEPTSLPAHDLIKDYKLTRLAGFRIQGRVLSVQRYHDPEAPLSPFDLVLGWGAMSDSAVVSNLVFEQGRRNYSFRWKDAPLLANKEVTLHSANLHLIPANQKIASLFGQLKPGCLVVFRGSLVEAKRPGFVWRSSLNREDTGPDSGELMYVTQAHFSDGKTNLAAKESHNQHSADQEDLKRWFEALQQRRQTLDLNDPVAVREFNQEAQRYMTAAHPTPTPAASPAPQK